MRRPLHLSMFHSVSFASLKAMLISDYHHSSKRPWASRELKHGPPTPQLQTLHISHFVVDIKSIDLTLLLIFFHADSSVQGESFCRQQNKCGFNSTFIAIESNICSKFDGYI